MLFQFVGAVGKQRKGHSGPLGNVQQRVIAVGEVQYPEPRQVLVADTCSSGGPVQPSAPQRGLAVGIQAPKGCIALEYVDDTSADIEGLSQSRRCHEVDVVGRGVILGKLAPGASHQAADGQIESGGTVLAFVVTIRMKWSDLMSDAPRLQHMGDGPVDLRVSPATLLVVKGSWISDTRQHQAVADS